MRFPIFVIRALRRRAYHALEVGWWKTRDAATARRYRQRAREVRVIAAEAEDLGLRSALLRVARDYERLALARLRIGKLARNARMKNERTPGKPRR